MSRIGSAFATLARTGAPGLVAYITAGDPSLPVSREVLLAVARAGTDVIEVGVPFSDPIADGPVIQRAAERALAAGGHLESSLAMVASVRAEITTPIVLFTYVNPVLQMGLAPFAAAASAAGVDGVLLLDLPIEEADEAHRVLSAAGVDLIFLISPTTTDTRLERAAALGRGFLYVISRMGVTGTRADVAAGARALVDRVRTRTTLPIALGFGLSRPQHVSEVCAFADAAVVGSALVERIAGAVKAGESPADAAEAFVRWLKTGGADEPR